MNDPVIPHINDLYVQTVEELETINENIGIPVGLYFNELLDAYNLNDDESDDDVFKNKRNKFSEQFKERFTNAIYHLVKIKILQLHDPDNAGADIFKLWIALTLETKQFLVNHEAKDLDFIKGFA